MRHDNWLITAYGSHVRGTSADSGPTFGELLKSARRRKGDLSQEDVWANTSTSKSTYGRYERDETSPDPETVRELCEYLEINTVEANLALGWISRDDLDTYLDSGGVSSEMARHLAEVAGILKDESVPRVQRLTLDHAIGNALGLWRSTIAMIAPTEPSRAELDGKKKNRTR